VLFAAHDPEAILTANRSPHGAVAVGMNHQALQI
jgi:hypothetical protein